MRNSLRIPQAAQAEAAKKKLQEQLAEDHRNDTCFGRGKWMELSCNGFAGVSTNCDTRKWMVYNGESS